jgi:hypothetical protein
MHAVDARKRLLPTKTSEQHKTKGKIKTTKTKEKKIIQGLN